MANLSLYSPWLSCFSFPNNTNATSFFTIETSPLKNRTFFASSSLNYFKTKASLSERQSEVACEINVSEFLDEELIGRVSAAKDASEVLDMIAERTERSGGSVSTSDCCSIMCAALDRNNADLALSIFYSMRSSFGSGAVVGEKGSTIDRWKWSRPNVHTYTLLISGLAASLRVSDALRMIANVCRVGVSPGEEVPFGKIVKCPSCMVAVAVAQPQHGIQIVSCSKCRYQYELVSGDIVSIESEEIRISSCRTQHGCSCMENGAKISANNEAKHSCCCSLHCGANPGWIGTDAQVCYSNSGSPCTRRRKSDYSASSSIKCL